MMSRYLACSITIAGLLVACSGGSFEVPQTAPTPDTDPIVAEVGPDTADAVAAETIAIDSDSPDVSVDSSETSAIDSVAVDSGQAPETATEAAIDSGAETAVVDSGTDTAIADTAPETAVDAAPPCNNTVVYGLAAMSAAAAPAFAPDTMCAEAWFKMSPTLPVPYTQTHVIFEATGAEGVVVRVAVYGTKVYFQASSANFSADTMGEVTFDTAKWNNVALCRGPNGGGTSNYYTYLNGALNGGVHGWPANVIVPNLVHLGYTTHPDFFPNPAPAFGGWIAEVHVSSAFSYPLDIHSTYVPVRRNVPAADTLLLYHANENTVAKLIDSSGLGRDALMTAGTWNIDTDFTPKSCP